MLSQPIISICSPDPGSRRHLEAPLLQLYFAALLRQCTRVANERLTAVVYGVPTYAVACADIPAVSGLDISLSEPTYG